jgi:beta-galactosidase
VFAAAEVEPGLPGLPPFVEVASQGNVITLINRGTESVVLHIEGVELGSGLAVDHPTLESFAYLMLEEQQ